MSVKWCSVRQDAKRHIEQIPTGGNELWPNRVHNTWADWTGTERFCFKENTIMNKKILCLLALMLCAAMMLTACGSKETTTDTASSKSDRVVIYTAAEDERIAYLQSELDKKFPNVEIVIQSLGTGQLLSKLLAEGTSGDCDIFYDLEVVNAEIILNANPDVFVDLSDYDFSIYDSSVTNMQ